MKKRFAIIVLAIVFVAIAAVIVACGTDYDDSDKGGGEDKTLKEYELIYEETEFIDGRSGYAVVGVQSQMIEKAVIPEIYNGKPVLEISFGAFCDTELREVVIPDSVVNIGMNAFCCRKLTELTIPESVTSVNEGIFGIGSTVRRLVYCEAKEKPMYWSEKWNDCFDDFITVIWDCKNNDKDADGYAYCKVNGIRYKVKDGEAAVAWNAYFEVSGKIDIMRSINYRGKTFSVTKVGENAFESCMLLNEISIPDSIVEIGAYAFAYCTALIDVKIPKSVDIIGEYAFTNIGLFNCEATEKPIGWHERWLSLYEIYYNDNEPLYTVWDCNRNDVDNNGYRYKSINGICYILKDGKAKVYRCPITAVGAIQVPSSIAYEGDSYVVDKIGRLAFLGCVDVTDITISANITELPGRSMFADCHSLTSIKLPQGINNVTYDWFVGGMQNNFGITVYCEAKNVSGIDDDGLPPFILDCENNDKDAHGNIYTVVDKIRYRINPDGTAEVASQPLKIDGDVRIRSQINYKQKKYKVTNIRGDAFLYRYGFSKVIIENGIETIGDDAFSFCDDLETVVIPDSVTFIDDRAFALCCSLTDVTIGSGITELGDKAFYKCVLLKFNEYKNGAYLGNASNKYAVLIGIIDNDLTEFTLSANTVCVDSLAFDKREKLNSIKVENNNTVFHSDGNCLIDTKNKVLISGCNSSVIPTDGSVTKIQSRAFAGCSSLTEIVVPLTVTKIGNGTFHKCVNLTKLTLPHAGEEVNAEYDSYTMIGDLFDSEMGLGGEENIPENLKTIVITGGDKIVTRAFNGCDHVENIILPNGIVSIGGSAFYNCERLTNINIPNTVTHISGRAFAYCKNLTRIIIPSSVTTIERTAFEDCENLTVYCEASKPANWDWGNGGWSDEVKQVVWGYSGNG